MAYYQLDVPLPADYEDTYRRDFPLELEDELGTLRWFGEPWPSAARPAAVCRPDAHIPTPVGLRCHYCQEEITEVDSGVRIPHLGFGDPPGMEASYGYYDLRCWLLSVGTELYYAVGMTEEERPEPPYKLLIRKLAERYPDEVAAELRELGYEVGEPAIQPVAEETPMDPEETESVLDLTLELLRQSQAPSVDIEIPGETWMGEATDEVIGAHAGQQLLVNVHTPDKCAGRACVLHNPSDHHMRDWPLLWRGDRRIMERRCPHGIGHPDPDDVAYQISIGADSGVHGCDGCCRGDRGLEMS